MSKKFDEYLNKGGFTQADREAVKVKDAQEVETNSAPTPVANDPDKARPDAPQPGLSQETKDRIESTQEGPGNNHEQSVADRYPSAQSKGEELQPQQDQEQDQER